MHPSELPLVKPTHHNHPLTPDEIWRIANGEKLANLTQSDPRVQAIQRSYVGNIGRSVMQQGFGRGYLFISDTYPDDGWRPKTRNAWEWWCAASKVPTVIIYPELNSSTFRVTCSLASVDGYWRPAALMPIGSLLSDCYSATGFIVSIDTVEVDGLLTEEAVNVADELYQLGRDGRFVDQEGRR